MNADHRRNHAVLSLSLGLACASPLLGSPPLFPGAQYTVGEQPRSVAVGDLNGDQVLDLAIANYLDDNAAVLLGAGDGTFVAATYYAAADGPESVAVGDLNGDQVLDLVLANANSDNVSVLLNIGDGTFGSAVHFPGILAVGDVDNDDDPDFVMVTSNDAVTVLLNVGDGTIAGGSYHAVGDQPASVAIGDLNSDEVPDVVSANYSGDSVSVLLGAGNGTFAAVAPIWP